MRLWNQKELKSLVTVQPTGLSEIVNDAAWSPHYPTVMASLTGDGKVRTTRWSGLGVRVGVRVGAAIEGLRAGTIVAWSNAVQGSLCPPDVIHVFDAGAGDGVGPRQVDPRSDPHRPAQQGRATQEGFRREPQGCK